MDIHYNICYATGHETPRNASAAGRPKTTCDRPVTRWQNLSVGRCNGKRVPELCRALGAELSKGRQEGPSPQVGERAPAALVGSAEANIAEASDGWADRCGLLNGPLDLASDRSADRKAFSTTLSSGPHLEDDAEHGVDVAEAGAQSHPERREGDRPLEEERLAAYKKKPEDFGRISPSSMKADFSSSRMSARRGGRSERPPFFVTATNGIGFPLSPPSPYPRNGVGSDCTFVFTPRTSPASKSFDSCAFSCDRSRATSFSSGTVVPSTGVSSSGSSCKDTSGFTYIASRRTHPKSIPTSSCGQRQSMRFRMQRLKTSRNSVPNSDRRFIAFETPSHCSGPAFMLRLCHGRDQCIHYLCETQ